MSIATKPCALLSWLLVVPAPAGIHTFQPDQPETRNLGVWRLTHDPAVRDYGNYHNIQCWSPNGRYTCYTRFAYVDLGTIDEDFQWHAGRATRSTGRSSRRT